jgi:hypothetical protein
VVGIINGGIMVNMMLLSEGTILRNSGAHGVIVERSNIGEILVHIVLMWEV